MKIPLCPRVSLNGDSSWIEQIFQNIFQNAFNTA